MSLQRPTSEQITFTPSGTGATATTVEDILDAQLMVDYVALRAYTGLAKTVRVTGLLTTAQPQGIAGFFQYDGTDVTSADNGGTIIVGGDGRRWKRVIEGDYNPGWFGAARNNIADDGQKVQDCIDSASAVGSLIGVDLEGYTYASSITIQIKQNVVLKNGRINYIGSTANAAVVSIGTGLSSLIRGAGAEFVRVSTTSTASGICGFRINGLVRSCWFKSCIAEMNENTLGTRGQSGFEIRSERLVTTGNAGAYQNAIDACTSINAKYGYRIYTEGTPAQQLADPQANANKICGFAFSCVTSAVLVEEGAFENEIDVRADTFVDQTGSATTIYVFDVRGSQNNCLFTEEIGSRADTQYTIRLGADAFWNNIKYKTQNVVTGRVLNNSTTNRNVLKWLNGTQNLGDDTASSSHYTQTAVAAGAVQEIRDNWVAPAPCVVVRAAAKLDANVITSGQFEAYFAKNAVFSTGNRIVFTVGEGTTAEFIITDPSAGTPINDGWVLAKGDTLTTAFSNSSPNAIKATATFAVRFLSTDADG